MIAAETVLGWAAIGLAASLAGMIWPFRRGVVGVVANALAAVLGAVCLPLVGVLVSPAASAADRNGARYLLLAAAGAIVGLAVAHVAWIVRAHRQPSRTAR